MASRLRYLALALPLALAGCGGSGATVANPAGTVDMNLWGGWDSNHGIIVGHSRYFDGEATIDTQTVGLKTYEISYGLNGSQQSQFVIKFHLGASTALPSLGSFRFDPTSSDPGTFSVDIAINGTSPADQDYTLSQSSGTFTILSLTPQSDGSSKLTYQIEIHSTSYTANLVGSGTVFIH